MDSIGGPSSHSEPQKINTEPLQDKKQTVDLRASIAAFILEMVEANKSVLKNTMTQLEGVQKLINYGTKQQNLLRPSMAEAAKDNGNHHIEPSITNFTNSIGLTNNDICTNLFSSSVKNKDNTIENWQANQYQMTQYSSMISDQLTRYGTTAQSLQQTSNFYLQNAQQAMKQASDLSREATDLASFIAKMM